MHADKVTSVKSLGSFGQIIYSSKEESDHGNVLCEQQQ